MFCPWGRWLWAKCMWVLDWFIVDNEESLLELPEMIPIKVKDPFLRIRKKLTPCYTSRPEDRLLWPSLEGKRRPQEETLEREAKSVKIPSLAISPQNPKGKE